MMINVLNNCHQRVVPQHEQITPLRAGCCHVPGRPYPVALPCSTQRGKRYSRAWATPAEQAHSSCVQRARPSARRAPELHAARPASIKACADGIRLPACRPQQPPPPGRPGCTAPPASTTSNKQHTNHQPPTTKHSTPHRSHLSGSSSKCSCAAVAKL